MRAMTTLSVGTLVVGWALGMAGCKDEGAPRGGASEGPTASAPAPAPAEDLPPAVGRRVLEAFKARDVDRLASLVTEGQRAEIREEAAEMFDAAQPRFAAMRDWDGRTLDVRYAGSAARVHFGPADGRLAVLEMEKAADGKWYWSGIRYASAEDFAAWGSTDPSAPVPSCHGDGKRVDARPLPEAWRRYGGAPAGAVACAFDDPDPNQYSFELGAGPEDGAKAWRAHLLANGWEITDVADDHGIALMATREGIALRVFTSSHVKDVGWTSVTVTSSP